MRRLIKKIFSLIFIGILFLPVSQEPQKEKKLERVKTPYYLVFPDQGIRKEIYYGLRWLDENKICSLHLIKENSTILLFGHNHTDVFHFLYEVEIGDLFFLEHGGKQEKYQVITKKIISVSQKNYLEIDMEHEIRMFTCTRNPYTRLMVRAVKTI